MSFRTPPYPPVLKDAKFSRSTYGQPSVTQIDAEYVAENISHISKHMHDVYSDTVAERQRIEQWQEEMTARVRTTDSFYAYAQKHYPDVVEEFVTGRRAAARIADEPAP